MLADFLDMGSSLVVNLHIQSVDQVRAIKTVKRKITDLDRAEMKELLTIKANVDRLMGYEGKEKERETEKKQEQSQDR